MHQKLAIIVSAIIKFTGTIRKTITREFKFLGLCDIYRPDTFSCCLTWYLSGQDACFMFGMPPIPFSPFLPDILITDFRRFPYAVRKMLEQCPKTSHGSFLQLPFHFTCNIHAVRLDRSTLCQLCSSQGSLHDSRHILGLLLLSGDVMKIVMILSPQVAVPTWQ